MENALRDERAARYQPQAHCEVILGLVQSKTNYIANSRMLIALTAKASVATMDNANVQSVRAMG